MEISLAFFLLSSVLYVAFTKWFAISLVIASFGSIFIALKYKLDQANFHKDLFQQRYTCASVIESAISEWARTGKVNYEMIQNITNIMRKSYFLFNNETYKHIKHIRECLIDILGTDNTFSKEIMLEKAKYLSNLMEHENFAELFPELKIETY